MCSLFLLHCQVTRFRKLTFSEMSEYFTTSTPGVGNLKDPAAAVTIRSPTQLPQLCAKIFSDASLLEPPLTTAPISGNFHHQ